MVDNSFRLESSAHKAVYVEEIEPAFFLISSSVKKPRAIIVGGQPGAGKSKVLAQSKQEFKDGNVVVVNTDDLRAFHPKFKEIIALDDKRSAERTHEDASGWNQMLLSRCIETNRNIILEGVFKDRKKLSSIIEALKKSDYEVVIRVVAVHERFSIWGIHERYEREKVERGHGRFVPLDYHNECYQNLLASVDLVEAQKVADRIEVYSRDGVCLYSNELAGGSWKQPVGACSAIEKERARVLTETENAHYRESWVAAEWYYKKNCCLWWKLCDPYRRSKF